MIRIALFGLLYVPSLSGMMNFTTTDLLCLRGMHRPQVFAIQECLNTDAICAILRQLSLKDQLSLTSTCTQYNALCVHAKQLKPKIAHAETIVGSKSLVGMATYLGVGPLVAFLLANNPYPKDQWQHTAEEIVAFTMATCIVAVMIKKTQKEDICSELDFTKTIYNTIAQRMHDNRLKIDALFIDYYAPSQVSLLLKVARKCQVKSVIINISSSRAQSPKRKPLKPRSFLANNKKLKNLEINDSAVSHTIDQESLYEGLAQNYTLKKLTLSSTNLHQSTLSLILRKKTLKSLSLNCCYPAVSYTLSELTQNTTLKHLTMKRVCISNDATPDLLIFMQHNKNLKSLVIAETSLNEESLTKLQMSPYKPVHCDIRGWE